METKQVPMRQMEVYQTDDGRRVEIFTRIKEIPSRIPQEAEVDSEIQDNQFSENEKVHVGVVHIMTQAGPKEIKFEIPDATSTEDAFDKYYEHADQAVAELKKAWEEQQRQAQNQIVVPDNVQAQMDGQEGSIIT